MRIDRSIQNRFVPGRAGISNPLEGGIVKLTAMEVRRVGISTMSRDELIAQYMPFRDRLVREYTQSNNALDPHDVDSVASESLMNAVNRFIEKQPECTAYTYIKKRFHWDMLSFIRSTIGREEYCVTGSRWEFNRLMGSRVSLSKIMLDGSAKPVHLSDMLPAKASKSVDLDFWRVACRGLNKVERLTILMYYVMGVTYGDIGKQLGVSQSRICQRIQQLLPRIQREITKQRHREAA